MKTMLAMALVFGFSALGCGVPPVDENDPVLEEEAQALTTSGYCEVYGLNMNGYCSAPLVGTACPARRASPTCVNGTVSTRAYPTCSNLTRHAIALSPVPCTF